MDAAMSRSGPSVLLLIVGAMAFGCSYGFLEETQGFGMAAWWLFIALAVVFGAAGVAMSNRHSQSLRPALKALPVLVAALCGLALGDFTAYLLEIDGRGLDNYGVSMSWETNLLATLSMAVLFGSLLGVMASLLAHVLRRSMSRDAA